MNAKILYFPNQGTTFRPDPFDQPITLNQVETLKDWIDWAMGFVNPDFSKQAKTYLYNKIRVTFCVRRLDDIPQRHFDDAISLVFQIKDVFSEYQLSIRKVNKLFIDHVFNAGDPWTPSLQTKWHKMLAKSLPDRPDWRKMAEELEARL